MTLVSGNNTQEARLSRSRCESDQEVPEVRDDGVDLGLQVKTSISCSNRMPGDEQESRFSYPDSSDSFAPPVFPPLHIFHVF